MSDGMPGNCYYYFRDIKSHTWDTTANWLPTATMVHNVNDQTSLNDILCNLQRSRDSAVPAGSGFTNAGTQFMTAWGVATDGAFLFNGLNIDAVDPFYPAPYGSEDKLVTNPKPE